MDAQNSKTTNNITEKNEDTDVPMISEDHMEETPKFHQLVAIDFNMAGIQDHVEPNFEIGVLGALEEMEYLGLPVENDPPNTPTAANSGVDGSEEEEKGAESGTDCGFGNSITA